MIILIVDNLALLDSTSLPPHEIRYAGITMFPALDYLHNELNQGVGEVHCVIFVFTGRHVLRIPVDNNINVILYSRIEWSSCIKPVYKNLHNNEYFYDDYQEV